MRDKRGQWETIGGQEGAMGAKGVKSGFFKKGKYEIGYLPIF